MNDTTLQGRKPVRIRASSFASLFDCPARWIAINLEGRRVPSNGKAALGTAIHAGTALYDGEVVAGQTPSASAAADAALASLRNPTEETVWDDDKAKAEAVAVSLTAKYCREESPKHKFVAVEAAIDSLLIADLAIVLTGTTDRIEETAQGFGIRDIKTGKQAVGTDGLAKTHGHGAQMGVYELIAENASGLPITAPAGIIGLQTNQTPDKQRIGTGEIVGAREVLLGNDKHTGLLPIAAEIVHGVRTPWGNPKSVMCHPTYCPNFSTCFWRR